MAINPPLSAPNVVVYEVQKTQTPIIASAILNPFITGPAKEIVKVFNEDGSLNSNAKQGSYSQLPLTISQLAFPSPRNNISEVTVETDTIRVFNNFSGTTTELPINPGSAFYRSWNYATRAAVRTASSVSYAIVGLTAVFSIDNPLRANTASDIAVTFTGTNPLTHAQIVDQLNLAFGEDVASVVTLTGDTYSRVEIASLTYGALSSVTVRSGGSANTLLGLAITDEDRVEGSGFRGQEDNLGSDTLTPWIEWFRGAYYAAGTATTFPTGKQYGLLDENGTFTNGQASALAFDGTGIDIKVGDQFYADGVLVNNGEVSKVETSRIKIGTINTTLSTYDANGKIVTIVRDPTTIKLLNDPVPFAPRYAYFKAQYLPSTNILATAATLTGANAGIAATSAAIASTTAFTVPVSLGGLNLKVTIIKDGVTLPEYTFTFSGGPFADANAVVAAIGSGIPNVVATNSSGKLVLSTILTGQNQGIILSATSTANSSLNFSTVTDTTDTGTDVTFSATKPVLTTSGNVFGLTLTAADTLSIGISTDSGGTFPTIKTHTSAGATYANIAALVAALQADSGFVGTDLVIGNVGNELTITTASLTGSTTVLRVEASSTAIGSGKIRYTSLQTDQGFDAISALLFKWKLNNRSKIYQTTFTSNSLIDAIAAINEAVGTTVAYPNTSTSNKLMFISTLKGAASKVEVISDSSTLQAVRALGFVSTNNIASGTGRPFPDAYLDSSGNLIISAEILRSPVTGDPFDPAISMLYIQYRGLRKDVSPAANNPGLLELSDTDTLETVLGPITAENPLALAMYFAMLNAPNVVIKGLGVDEISAVYPEGTPDAYQRAIDFSSGYEIYAMAPLSQEEAVHRLFATHVISFADPVNENSQRERRVYINPKFPTRAMDTLIGSGLAANTPVSTTNQINLDVNTSAALLAAGINPAIPIPYSSQVFLKVTTTTGIKNYSVAQVNGVVITLRTSFTSSQNTDSFYESTTLSTLIINAAWSLNIRGAELLIPGSTLPDKQKIAETINQYAQTFKHKRVSYIFADEVSASLDGLTQVIKGYYPAAAYTGVNAYQRPQQPLSNFPITGFNGTFRTKGYFNDKQLNLIAGGGVMILVNDKAGLPIYARHQLTTDVSSIETQEDSILRAVDTVALLTRSRVKQFLGNRNITPDLYSDLATLLDAIKSFLINDVGALADFKVLSLLPDPNRKDGVILEIGLTVLYPVNKISIYLYF